MTDPSEQAGPSQATPAAPSPDDQRPRPPRRVRVHHLREAKERGERITMLTAYDAPTAQIFDEVGTDVLLVGDSLGDNFYGYPSTCLLYTSPSPRDRTRSR